MFSVLMQAQPEGLSASLWLLQVRKGKTPVSIHLRAKILIDMISEFMKAQPEGLTASHGCFKPNDVNLTNVLFSMKTLCGVCVPPHIVT